MIQRNSPRQLVGNELSVGRRSDQSWPELRARRRKAFRLNMLSPLFVCVAKPERQPGGINNFYRRLGKGCQREYLLLGVVLIYGDAVKRTRRSPRGAVDEEQTRRVSSLRIVQECSRHPAK